MTIKQQEILQHAIELFNKKGFKGTSVRDLAAQLDIKAASLYFHFKSKDEILKAICYSIAEDFNKVHILLDETKCIASKKLELLIDLHLQVVFNNTRITQIYSNEWQHLDEKSKLHFKQERKRYQNKIQSHLEQIFSEMQIQHPNVELCTLFLLHTLNHSYKWFNTKADKKNIFVQIKQKILYGLLNS